MCQLSISSAHYSTVYHRAGGKSMPKIIGNYHGRIFAWWQEGQIRSAVCCVTPRDLCSWISGNSPSA